MAVPSPVKTALALALALSTGLVSVMGNAHASTSLDLSQVKLRTESAPAPSTTEPAPTTPEADAPTKQTARAPDASTNRVPASSNSSAAATSSTPQQRVQLASQRSNAQEATSRTYEGSMVQARPRYRDPFGNRITEPLSLQRPQHKEQASGSSYGSVDSASSSSLHALNFPQLDLAHAKVAVVYFGVSENLESTDIDELTGASIIYNRNHERRSITEYLAELIAERTHAELFRLDRLSPYSNDHDELIYQASLELDERTHPEIVLLPPIDLTDFDVIFIGYPIWWYELPMPLYSFFEQYDLSGKIVVPFCTHGGSRAYKTFALIAQQEPNAYVLYNDGLIIDRLVVPTHGQSSVELWLKALTQRLNHELPTPVGLDLDRNSPILQQSAPKPQQAPELQTAPSAAAPTNQSAGMSTDKAGTESATQATGTAPTSSVSAPK